MLAVIVVEALRGVFSIQWALIGIIIGLVVGAIVSRIYQLSWDVETNNVIGSIDWVAHLYAGVGGKIGKNESI